MCHANNQKPKKTKDERDQEKTRSLGEKEIYKYLGILETDTIKQVETKEKNLKRIHQENEKNFLKLNYKAKISAKI